MAYPDNFRWDTFDRHYGTDEPAPNWGKVERAVDHARRIQDAAKAFLAAVEGIPTGTEMSAGYELCDVLDQMQHAASRDLSEFEGQMIVASINGGL
jgi:hypothetical protein